MTTRPHDLTAPTLHRSQQDIPQTSDLSPQAIAARLRNGIPVRLDSSFRDGQTVLSSFKQTLQVPKSTAPFQKREQFELQFRTQTSWLWVALENGHIQLAGIDLGNLIETLYGTNVNGYLSFHDIREMAGAWKRIQQGIHFAVLGQKLHPFFGVYFPTRTEHLELFTTWLSQYKGPKRYAVDVGTGSGILSFLLLKNGFEQVLGTDMNPNALWSAQNDAQRLGYQGRFATKQTDLLNDIEPTSLIVFNPPWIPGRSHSSVDDALFFEQGLFTRFFDQATEKLLPNGRIVLIFSTILTLLRPDIPHPIETELSKGRFLLLNKMQRKVKPTNGKRTKEKVQIWELSLNE